MVSSEQTYIFWVAKLEAQKVLEGLDGMEAPVNKVPDKNVFLTWDLSPYAEQLEKVIELAVNVATHSHWRSYGLDVGLLILIALN